MNKLVVITGVTRGLGREMVERFHEAGWTVAGCGRSEKEVQRLRQQFGEQHHFSVVDVSVMEQVEKWAEEIRAEVGVPDLLINNASIINRNSPVIGLAPNEFSRVMDINVNGVFYVIRAFLPFMIQRANGGVVVNISSYWGRYGEAFLSPYCASKFAIEGLTQSLAAELPEGMAAVTLDPGGSIDTAMLRSCSPEDVDTAPNPVEWSRVAVPYIIGLGPQDNGKSLTCPPVRKSTN
ncbi:MULTISPECIES: SDR family oxidoreductase [Brevibacillus]|uniref:SDR family oxidoreductase n=1 Tax=Brevibacillus TaxID=55080 RepID=UPI00156B3482|nr:SDR family oxidoreductase [Brevibacillus sp. RS1.1]NRR05158.1 SDR family oxidoreductase [Brevibacillus sp. RS1.1]